MMATGLKLVNLYQVWVIQTYFYETLMNYAWDFLHIKWCEDMSEWKFTPRQKH